MPKEETPAKKQNPLLVLGKISAILDSFSLRQPVMSLADLRESTTLPASTVQRLVANLVEQGFLDRDGDAYRIGMKMAYWAAPATRGKEVLDVISPLLAELRDFTGETTCLFRAEQHYRVCVGISETRHMLRREMHLGELAPLHAGSAGRVLLAWKPGLMQSLMESSLESLTESTITGMADLEKAVDQTRADGFAITTGERESGASGLSAPVFDSAAGLVAAVTISGPTMRMSREVCESWIEPLLETAERMTRLIGGRFPGETHRPAV